MLAVSQSTAQKQCFSVSQSTISACNVLSMGIDELYSYIQEAVNENPLISFESLPSISSCCSMGDFHPSREESIDFAADLSGERSVFHAAPSLSEYLMLQIRPGLSPREDKLVRYLIQCLDADGYFRESAEELAALLGRTALELERAIHEIQLMDPPGIGARNLRECLLLQLGRMKPRNEAAYRIIREHFDNLAKNKIKAIAAAMGCTTDDVNTAVNSIRALECRPASLYCNPKPRYIAPDVEILEGDGGFQIQLNRDAAFDIRLDEEYESLLSCEEYESARNWIRSKKKQAAMLQLFIKKRNQTLLLVCEEIFQAQKPFFYKGCKFLRPLRQKDIADALSCHESTVWRAVNGKYLHCAWGTFPLSYFFSNQLECEDGFDASNPKLLIGELVAGEDKLRPLSDSALAEKLEERGIHISRRTVAKYRDEVHIPSVSMRRIYA